MQLLQEAEPREQGFDEVVVWGNAATLAKLQPRDWLHKSHQPLLDRSLPFRQYWQRFMLDRLAVQQDCQVLFIPGGSYGGSFQPYVAMSQNMLPFEWKEARRYGVSWMTLRLMLLTRLQTRTFRRASALVFLTDYARTEISRVADGLPSAYAVVPHGIDKPFFMPPREQRDMSGYSPRNPFRVLYVSIVDVYKHQWHVAEAAATLRKAGIPIQLDLVGPAYAPAGKRLNAVLQRVDPASEFIRVLGPLPYHELPTRYQQADAFVFASSCENLPNILLEAMAAGLPIACSNRGPMPEVLCDCGQYFDPESPSEIAEALRTLVESPSLRAEQAAAAFKRAQQYSWKRCADQTLSLLAQQVNPRPSVSNSELSLVS